MSTLERLKKLFVDKFDFNVEELKPTTTLEHLGLDSLDKIEFMFDIENEFKIPYRTSWMLWTGSSSNNGGPLSTQQRSAVIELHMNGEILFR